MPDIFFIKRNDTSPSIQKTLTDAAGAAINLTGATIRFHMRAKDGTTKVDATADTVGDATLGVVKYDWIAADTDTAGFFDGEFEATYADTTVETFPNGETITIQIPEDLA